MRPERAAALGREIERLRSLPVFGCLDPEALRHLAFSAETRRIDVGQVLFRRGEPAEAAVLVASGTLVLDAEREGGTAPRRASGGTLLNEAALFAPGLQAATATAENATAVVLVSRALMMRVLDVYPDNAPALRLYWAGRLAARLAEVRAAIRP